MYDDPNIDFHSLDYGIYSCENYFTENIKYDMAEINKLYVRAVRLPEGKSNIIYVLSDSFEHSIDMFIPANRNFIMMPIYKRMYYPQLLMGSFMSRRFKFNLFKQKESRAKMIVSQTGLRMVPNRYITNDPFNNYIVLLADLYENIKPIAERFPLQRLMKEFFKELIEQLKNLTPEKNEKDERPSSNNRILLIDAKNFQFKPNGPIDDNKLNPLFLFYISFLRLKDLSQIDVDMDMMICARNMFIKFNPAKLVPSDLNKFKLALFRIMNANLDEYVDKENKKDQYMIDKPIENKRTFKTVDDAIRPFTMNVSDDIKNTLVDHVSKVLSDQKLNADKLKEVIFKKIEKPEKPKSFVVDELGMEEPKEKPEESTEIPKEDKAKTEEESEYEAEEIDTEEEEQEKVKDTTLQEILNNKKVATEVDDEIQDKIAPMRSYRTAPVNSARDFKLREAQKKVRVQNSTIEEILARDSANLKIETDDYSQSMKTANQNVKKMTFNNFNKTYLEHAYVKDIVSMFDQLKDKSSPFMITGIEVKDSSTVMDYKETWTVHLTDEVKGKHTITVDLPKFIDNRFMLLGGNKWIILNQNLYNPLTKENPDTVILTTQYNKITIERYATKSLSYIERMFSMIKKHPDNNVFTAGNLMTVNKNFVCALEYDEYSKRLFSFKSKDCEIYFSRPYLKETFKDITGLKDTEYFIGKEKGTPIIIDENTGLDRQGRTITKIIEQNLPDEMKQTYASTKPPSAPMFVRCKLAGQFMPVVAVFIIWLGITKLLKELKVEYKFYKDAKVVGKKAGKDYIRFANGVLEYDNPLYVQLIMNGFNKLNPKVFKFEDFDTDLPGNEFIKSVWGNYQGIPELQVYYEFGMDPITKEICNNLNLPDYIEGLMIHAVKLLTDDHHELKPSDKLFRTRSIEVIPSILHMCLARQYKAYIKSGRKTPMSLRSDAVIKELIDLTTVEEYSTLNPPTEVGKASEITCRGYVGINLEQAYDQDRRSFHESSIGRIAMSTDPSGIVGINRQLVVEPTLTNIRGQRDPVDPDHYEELKDVNIMSPMEMVTAGTYRIDDAFRIAMSNKQSGHIVPISSAIPALVSNGYDEAIQFQLSDDFVINAEDDGEVVEVNDELGFIMLKYKNGKCKAINVQENLVKNSGGGFYISNKLMPVYTKVGQKFKKNDPLAYHPQYFRYSELTGLRYCIGALLKVAFMPTYNTHEDGGLCTMKVAEEMKTNVVYREVLQLKKNTNIVNMVKIGDHVGIGDPLVRYNSPFEDSEITKYLSKLSAENKLAFEDELKTELKASHAGRIIDIKIYSAYEPSEMSDTLGQIVSAYFNKNINRRKMLEKYDNTPGIYKCGYLFRDSTEPVHNKYNQISSKYKHAEVLMEIYIEHDLLLGVGDKVAMYSANKNVISEIIKPGFEPYSEFRPEEEVSMLTAPGTINRRMTTSVLPIVGISKVLVELKRKIKEMAKFNGVPLKSKKEEPKKEEKTENKEEKKEEPEVKEPKPQKDEIVEEIKKEIKEEKKEPEEKVEEESKTEPKTESTELSNEIKDKKIVSSPNSNKVYYSGKIKKIFEPKFDKLYFGSPNKLDDELKLNGPLFVTPYKGIASIFAVRPKDLEKYDVPKGIKINKKYKEWDHSLKNEILEKPFKEVHCIIEGYPELKETSEDVSGYIYEIEMNNDVKTHIYQSSTMDEKFEYCIDHINSVKFQKIEKINSKLIISGNSLKKEIKTESTNYRTNDKISINNRKKIDNFKFDKVYFGSD